MVDKKILMLSTLILLVFVMSVISIHIQKNDIKAIEQKNNTDSSNWAGYIAASSISNPQAAVTGISGSWIVQNVNASDSCTYSAQWIGIGGFFSNDQTLIQTGTTSQYDCGSSFSAWYEILPAAETPINMNVQPGNIITAHIFLAQAPDTWHIYLNDTSENEHFYKSLNYNSSMLSAEWIEERPEIDGQLSCLSNFGTAYYGNYYTGVSSTNYVTINGETGPINDFAYENVTMTSNSGTLAVPGPLLSNGSFNMEYTGTNACCCYCCF